MNRAWNDLEADAAAGEAPQGISVLSFYELTGAVEQLDAAADAIRVSMKSNAM